MSAMTLGKIGRSRTGAHGNTPRLMSPLPMALIGALAVGVISGASVAATASVQNDRVAKVQQALDDQTIRAKQAEKDLAALREQAAAAEVSSARRTDALLAKVGALQAQVAQVQTSQQQGLDSIQQGLSTLERRRR